MFWKFFLYFGYKFFIRYIDWKNFLSVCGLSIHSLNSDFNVDTVELSIFFNFMDHIFGDISKSLPNSESLNFLLCSVLKVLVFRFYIWSVIYFIIYVYIWCDTSIKIYFFLYECPIISAAFIEILLSLHWIAFVHCRESVSQFVYFVPLIYFSVFTPMPHCHDYSSFISLEHRLLVLQLYSFSNLFWLFESLCISILILESTCQFL